MTVVSRSVAPAFPELKPLPARSVVLSLLLGAHPDRLSPSQLVSAGEHFGIPAATTRVALSRAAAAGDLRRDGGDYMLGERLVARQRRQDEAVADAEKDWDGTWEMAVVVGSPPGGPAQSGGRAPSAGRAQSSGRAQSRPRGRPPAERAALRQLLLDARLAELREGIWTRPANLRRGPPYAAEAVLSCFSSRPYGDPRALANALWDLGAWASSGRALLEQLDKTRDPAFRLAAAAHVVRHLTTDPLLPAELLPRDWPGEELRAAYGEYQANLRGLVV
jgi:phenylacetic acid degradation operon negative regulatory protein